MEDEITQPVATAETAPATQEAPPSEQQAESAAESESLRKNIADLEAQKQRIIAEQTQNEAAAAATQERISATLGTHNILDIVREEDKALLAVYERRQQAARNRLSGAESNSNQQPISG
jgi:hypothetical protein